MNDEESIIQQQEVSEEEQPEVKQNPVAAVPLSENTKIELGVDPENKQITNAFSLNQNDSNLSLNFLAEVSNKKPTWNVSGNFLNKGDNYNLGLNAGLSQTDDGKNYQAGIQGTISEDRFNASAVMNYNNGTLSGSAEVKSNISVGNVELSGDGSITVDENGVPAHNINASAETQVGKTHLATQIHNDRNDTSITLTGHRPKSEPDNKDENKNSSTENDAPLLRADNNPLSEQAQYQARKEGLKESGELFNLSLKGGYSNEDSGFYTSNALMANLGKGNFLNLNFTARKSQTYSELLADLNKVNFKISDNIQKPKQEGEVKTRTQVLDAQYKGNKNLFSAHVSHEKQYPTEGETVTNYGIGAKAAFNQTQYGEFNGGLNGALNGTLTQQGFKLGGNLSYNWYGSEHGNNRNDYMVYSNVQYEKSNLGKNFESVLSSAIRFNNCRTIIEPRSSFELKETSENGVTRTFSNGVSVFQQTGKKFGDSVVYAGVERVISHGEGGETFTQLRLGGNKKANEKLTYNFETEWKNTSGLQGAIGLTYNF